MKRSITYKIIFSYLLVVLISMAFVGFIFKYYGSSYFERQTSKYLKSDAYDIEQILKKSSANTSESIQYRLRQLRDQVRKGIGTISSDCIIYSKDLNRIIFPGESPIFSRASIMASPIVKAAIQKHGDSSIIVKVKSSEYYIFIHPVKTDSGNIGDWILTFAPIDPIKQVGRGMLVVLLTAMIFTSFPTIIFGVFVARSIAKPIIKLKDRAELLSKRDFDSRVEVRTGDELEELANTINKMAAVLKEYDIAQKKFMQNASHELKTPLMSIQGYAEGIKDGVFEDNEQALEIIVEESTRLKSIVEDLIFLSKLETMEDFYKFSSVSINEIIEKSIEKVNSLTLKDNINIKKVLDRDMVLKADRDKITQALINILGNCIRYARSEINISTINQGNQVDIRIHDDGSGFEEKDLENIFVRFYKGKKGSTGLGMAITKVIIEKHGGSISASNSEKGGAEFVMSIPYLQDINK
ncbi:MAG: HAMP domain-containing sensor histidine kinase [Bacillota bacterium]|nr:HAMP domain-containing sensor histidine kinase [Bacillota bacterium]